MKTHRIGTVTLGSILIIFGSLFLSHILFPSFRYATIFRCWPLILIAFGIETLYCSRKYENFSYDFGAVCMTLLLGFLTACMAFAELAIRYSQMYLYL